MSSLPVDVYMKYRRTHQHRQNVPNGVNRQNREEDENYDGLLSLDDNHKHGDVMEEPNVIERRKPRKNKDFYESGKPTKKERAPRPRALNDSTNRTNNTFQTKRHEVLGDRRLSVMNHYGNGPTTGMFGKIKKSVTSKIKKVDQRSHTKEKRTKAASQAAIREQVRLDVMKLSHTIANTISEYERNRNNQNGQSHVKKKRLAIQQLPNLQSKNIKLFEGCVAEPAAAPNPCREEPILSQAAPMSSERENGRVATTPLNSHQFRNKNPQFSTTLANNTYEHRRDQRHVPRQRHGHRHHDVLAETQNRPSIVRKGNLHRRTPEHSNPSLEWMFAYGKGSPPKNSSPPQNTHTLPNSFLPP